MLALSALHSQPVPGWAVRSNIDNSSSEAENIKAASNNSTEKSNQNNSFNNSINNPSSSAEGQNNNLQNKNDKSSKNELSKEEQRELEKLKRRDREVRNHEMAHQSAGGQYAGSASYTYTTGPDDRRYAVGGSVDIETSPAKDPEQTVKKAEQIKRAATAPAQPSAADLQIAAKATRMKMEAQAELSKSQGNGSEKENDKNSEINQNKDSEFENKYLINKRESSYQNSTQEINFKQGFAA